MTTTYIGIDPGLDGAVAVLTPLKSYQVHEEMHAPDVLTYRTFVTPTIKVSRGRDYNEPAMRAVLEETHNPVAFLEKQHAMPGQGVRSMFMTGGGFYLWRGLLAGLGVPYEIVTAKTWQKAMHGVATGDTKGRSILACNRLFPHVSLLASSRCRKPHDGIADALLIAEYGRRVHAGQRSPIEWPDDIRVREMPRVEVAT